MPNINLIPQCVVTTLTRLQLMINIKKLKLDSKSHHVVVLIRFFLVFFFFPFFSPPRIAVSNPPLPVAPPPRTTAGVVAIVGAGAEGLGVRGAGGTACKRKRGDVSACVRDGALAYFVVWDLP